MPSGHGRRIGVHWGEKHTNNMTFGETGKIGRTRADREKQAPGIVSAALNKLETLF